MASSFERPFHPIDLSEDAAALFPLRTMIDELRQEDVYKSSSRNALALIHDEGLRAVLTVAKEGVECGDHTSPEPTVVVNLAGRLAIKGSEGAGMIQLSEGTAAALAPNLSHRLAAVTECAYLTIVGSRAGTEDGAQVSIPDEGRGT